ncbi:hypothetical protein SteCoe_22753 [Stentor coeruleus]|uniref:Uncharacterized protein n=1 Tax=Stentor coeruleus TaxID=5963 RepID=A0A1R2BLG6_9CILI|nr:hypothetical protein SteCoe_22753 [Stentor coeruleus]
MNFMPGEFDLFDFETKLRSLISTLISPIITKSAEHDAIITNMQSANKKNEESVRNFESLLQKTIVRMVPADEFNRKIVDLHSDKKSSDTVIHMKIESLGSRVDFMNHQFSDMLIRIKNLEEIQKHLRYNFDELTNSMREFKEKFMQNISTLEVSIAETSQIKGEVVQEIEKELKCHSAYINDINQKAFPEFGLKVERLFKQISDIHLKLNGLYDVRVLPNDIKKLKNKLEHDIKKAHKDNDREIHNVREYLNKMLRVEISCGVGETLLQVLDTRQIKKLIPVVEGQLSEFPNTENLPADTDFQVKSETISTELLRKKTLTQNKNIEEKIQAAKDKIYEDSKSRHPTIGPLKRLDLDSSSTSSPFKNPSDLGELSTKREQETKRVDNKSREETLEVENKRHDYNDEDVKKDDNDQKHLHTIVSSPRSKGSDFYEKYSDLSFDPSNLQEQITQLTFDMKCLQQTREEITNMMASVTQALKRQVVESEKEFSTTVKILGEESKQLAKQRLKDLSDVYTFIDKSLEPINEKLSKYDSIDMRISKVQESVSNVLEGEKIIYELIAQDEQDRRGIQLMGYSENHQKIKNTPRNRLTVSLKPECLSCTGENPLIYSAFKMACLNYNPSEVKYNFRLYPRKSLIEKLGEFLISLSEDTPCAAITERLKPYIIADESAVRIKSHQRTRTASRYILDISSSKMYFDNETPLHSKREIRVLHK